MHPVNQLAMFHLLREITMEWVGARGGGIRQSNEWWMMLRRGFKKAADYQNEHMLPKGTCLGQMI